MYDGGKIITGLIIFIGLMTFPVWHNGGSAGVLPKVEKPVGKTACVLPTVEMRSSHMLMLNQWRDEALREENRKQFVVEGQTYEKSLMLGCLNCHTDKKKFCDECHLYTAVKPYCWDCHFPPKENF